MTPYEKRAAAVKLLAEIDQKIAECENLASEPILSYDEEEYLAVQLDFQRKARTRVEQIIESVNESA